MRIEQVVKPPELPRRKNRKRTDLALMATAYFVALVVFLLIVVVLGWRLASMPEASLALATIVGAIVIYVVLGGVLCAVFIRRLAWWNDASLDDAVKAKMNFVYTWPWAAGRLLILLLLFHALA